MCKVPWSPWKTGHGQKGTLCQKLFCVMKCSADPAAKHFYFSLMSVEASGILENQESAFTLPQSP